MLNYELAYNIIPRFQTTGSVSEVTPAGTGLIHDTWFIQTTEKDEPDFVLQKVNDHVFPCVPEMMENIQKVTDHIRNKKDPGEKHRFLEVIQTRDKKSFIVDEDGQFWRMFRKIDPGICYDKVVNPAIAQEAGRAFGQFIADLIDFPVESLYPVIPDFHSIESRYDQLQQAIKNDSCDRVHSMKKEIDFVSDQIDRMMVIPGLVKKGILPVRVTHNDTKLNNVLFDDRDVATCVIDLDTVMPGLTLYDYGDTLRSAANTAEEDEKNLDKINFNIPIFEAYTDGFLERTIPFLTESEQENLVLSPQYMTFIMGVRFLTDYISGDIYYQIRYEDQNLRRCRAQFQLVQKMMDAFEECTDIFNHIAETKKDGR